MTIYLHCFRNSLLTSMNRKGYTIVYIRYSVIEETVCSINDVGVTLISSDKHTGRTENALANIRIRIRE